MTSHDADFDWGRYESELADLAPIAESLPVPAPTAPPARTAPGSPEVDGAALLAELRAALCRYLVMPTPEAADAVVLWIAATHAQPAWEHASRLAITGPARRCGKSRLMEIVKATSYKALPAVNASTAAMYRSIDDTEPPTIMLDEADTQFGTKKAADANEDLRALLNAGHSRGWPILRCVGANQEVKAFASYAMAALAGIGDLPDTITDRAVNIRMRRRAPGEEVKPFRIARDTPPLHAIRDRINRWVRAHLAELRDAEPAMPIEDRAADTWESLIAIADLAGGDWPQRARNAALKLTRETEESDTESSLTTRLLADLRTVFAEASKLHTTTILAKLHEIEDSPWAARDLSAHGLSAMLRPFGIKPKDVREEGTGLNRKGYDLADLRDAFSRYLRPVADETATGQQTATALTCDVADVAAPLPSGDTDPGEPPTEIRDEPSNSPIDPATGPAEPDDIGDTQ